MKKLLNILGWCAVGLLSANTGFSQTPATVAAEILDHTKPDAERVALVAKHQDKAAKIIAAMTADLAPNQIEEEYKRIPWIWRVASATGKSNNPLQIKKLAEVALPSMEEPLREWQAVAVGGGIVDGLSLAGNWPRERVAEILKGDKQLIARWKRAIVLASAMADDPKVKNGTRYDALRILGVETWDNSGTQLSKYLAKGINAELQQGAISGVSDIKSSKVAPALLSNLPHFSDHNKNFALDALLRDEDRANALLTAIEKKQIDRALLGSARVEKLKNSADKKISKRAQQLFATSFFEQPHSGKIYSVGVAKIDVTPDYPVRLMGYLGRQNESEGVIQHIFAKAIAIGSDKEGAGILITLDNCIIPTFLREELLGRLNKRGITSDKLAICVSHTHSGPKLTGAADNIFGADIPPEHQAHIDRYTKELIDKIEQVSLAALKDRKPSQLSWGQTKAGFAANRRTAGGPVDHDLPVLKVSDRKGKIRALLANYACHCTTLSSEPNQICGDWAGYAQEYLEQNLPGTIAMIAIGCGADANPSPRPGVDFAKQHGQSITTSVCDMLAKDLTPLHGNLEGRIKKIMLPFDTLPTRAEWEEKAKKNDPPGYQARKNLARLDRGEKLQIELPYLVQTWNFSDELAMVFLPGEVVVDYSLRLKKEFDASRLWVNAYANDVPCYIPSKRILNEGGYEGGGAMVYYDRPTRLGPDTEEKIISTVHELMPKKFIFDKKAAEFPAPKTPAEALRSFHFKPDFAIDLAATEPLIVDPVAIDFGTDGKLWVCEMHDYPSGMDGNFKVAGGRIKLLTDKNGDGKFDQSSLFLDGLTFPTGLMQWRKGVLICAAPDILYAEDTNGDGKADIIKKLFSGFATHNFQARVNSLRWGLDNWVYGSGGLFGGKIHSEISGKDIECSGRDFRFNPDTGEFESAGGISQQSRVRDDFGNWFGCDNSTLLWHFPLQEKYVRRNLHVTAPEPRIFVGKDADQNLLFPTSRTLERFNNPNSANRTTSACGVEMYRDDLLGKNFYGNSFVAEPVHNLVHRYLVQPDGLSFAAHRPEDEKNREFLTSTDNWFRPVEIRTGPDGALWVVDMYRFVIEHPRWISAERLATLDLRAGDDKGRIYRVYPKNTKLQPAKNLTRLKTSQLVASLETSSGTERDLVHRELFQRADPLAITPLKSLAAKTKNPAVKIQALSALEGLGGLTPELILSALNDVNNSVRENAIRLSEPFLKNVPAIGEALVKLTSNPEIRVRYQLALSLGEWNDPRAGKALGELAKNNLGDQWMRAAVLSSASFQPGEILKSVLTIAPETAGRNEIVGQLIATAAGSEDTKVFDSILIAIAPAKNQKIALWQLTALGSLQEALERKKLSLDSYTQSPQANVREAASQIQSAIQSVGEIAKNEIAALADRQAAIRLLSWGTDENNLQMLVGFATQTGNEKLQKAAQQSLRAQRNPKLPEILMNDWKNYPLAVRSGLLEILMSRDEGVQKVLDAIGQDTIKPAEIPLVNRQLLLKHENKKVQERAASLFPQNESRKTVLAKFTAEVPKLTGNADHGAEVFARACANCHSFRGQGFAVGPELMSLGDKSAQDFLLAILDPGSVIEPRYLQFNIETKDGRSLSGVIQAETAASITLVQGGGVREKILRADISEIRTSALSLMPEGLEEGNSPQDFADLIAYLKTRPATFGGATPQQTAEARKSFLAGTNVLVQLVSATEKLDYPSWLGSLPLAHCRQTDGQAKVIWQSAPAPSAIEPNQNYFFRAPIAMGFFSEPSGKFQLKMNGKPAVDFNVTLSDGTWSSRDGKVVLRYQVMENNAQDSNGILTISVRGDLLAAGKPVTFEVSGSKTNSQRWFGVYLLSANTK